MALKGIAAVILAASIVFSSEAAIAINGTVKDQATQAGIQGAIVSLAATGLTTVTDNNGRYSFSSGVSVAPVRQGDRATPKLSIVKGWLLFSVTAAAEQQVRIDLFTVSGKLVRTLLDKRMAMGEYRVDLPTGFIGTQSTLIRVRCGKTDELLMFPLFDGFVKSRGTAVDFRPQIIPSASAKAAAAVDTILAGAVGYGNASLGIDALTGTYDLALQRIVPAGQAMVLQSSQTADKVSQKPSLAFATDDGSTQPTVTITPSVAYQSIVGFGAAFTETSVFNLCKIAPAKKAQVLSAFFNPYTGAGYSLCRVSINSCDFSLGVYSYDETPGDYTLNNFDISHEKKWLIPTLREAMAIPGSTFRLFGSPWSPPAWMKSNGTMLNGGQLKADCFAAWALYYVKYINAMRDNGISIWGLTVQNEPWATQTWESCIYTSQQERDFVKNYLGPTLAKNNVSPKLMIWDHNKDIIVERATTVLSDTVAAKYVWGTAYHHYAGDYFPNMTAVHDAFPQKPLLGTENSVHAGFSEVERMAHEIIGDLNNWSSGYLTWNLVTDLNGGPFHDRSPGVPGDALVDTATSSVTFPPNYYYMTHFSKYIRPEAVRIGCSYTGTDIEATACRNTNGIVVVAVLNRTNNAVNFKLKQGTQIIKPSIPAHSLIDIIY